MLHFAPRHGIISPCLTRAQGRRLSRPANDNIGAREEALLEAALRMFAAHGLSAALRACEAAEIAAAGGDHEGAAWWLEVCAAFDSALARTAARAFAARQIAGR